MSQTSDEPHYIIASHYADETQYIVVSQVSLISRTDYPMFLHHVLRDLDYSLNKVRHGYNLYYGDKPIPKAFWNYVSLTRKQLFHAQCFHVGNIEDFTNEAQNRRTVGGLFSDKTLRLPYVLTWFDWFDHTVKINGRRVTLKKGVLVEVVEEDPYVLTFTPLDTFTSDSCWTNSPISLIMCVTGNFGASKFIEALRKKNLHFRHGEPLDHSNSVLFLYHLAKNQCELWEELQGQLIMSAFVVEQTLIFLSCKNIVATSISPPFKLQKKRKKQGKLPLFTYKVLTIKPGKQKRGPSSPVFKFDPKRVHLCMGHYKEYTVDAPLFGKVVGRYFWKPHVRGTNTDGIVIKDYQIKGG